MTDDRPDSIQFYPAPAARRSAGMGRSQFTDSFGRVLPPLGDQRKRMRD